MKIRRALPNETFFLSSLAFRSKKVWGYDNDFMDQCRQELTVSSEYIVSNHVFVLEDDGQTMGFYSLIGKEIEAYLDFLFIEPAQVNRGYGKNLWQHAVNKATELGFEYILIDSDPNAQGFYFAMGAKLKGEVSSNSIAGRTLPLLCFTIEGERT